MPRDLDAKFTPADRLLLREMGDALERRHSDGLFEALAAAHERLEAECARAYRAKRRYRRLFFGAAAIAGVMGFVAIASWLAFLLHLRGRL